MTQNLSILVTSLTTPLAQGARIPLARVPPGDRAVAGTFSRLDADLSEAAGQMKSAVGRPALREFIGPATEQFVDAIVARMGLSPASVAALMQAVSVSGHGQAAVVDLMLRLGAGVAVSIRCVGRGRVAVTLRPTCQVTGELLGHDVRSAVERRGLDVVFGVPRRKEDES